MVTKLLREVEQPRDSDMLNATSPTRCPSGEGRARWAVMPPHPIRPAAREFIIRGEINEALH